MTTSLGPVSDSTEAMLNAERNHSLSSSTTLIPSPPSEILSNGSLLQPSGPKQNGHTNVITDNIAVVHHSNGHPTENSNIFNSQVYV